MIKMENISKTYSRDGVPVTALREAEFQHVDDGDFVSDSRSLWLRQIDPVEYYRLP